MLNFFKKKQNQVEIPEVKPMEYWEENSYMMAVSEGVEDYCFDGAQVGIKNIKGVKLISFTLPTDEAHGSIILEYKGDDYGVGFYLDNYEMGSLYSMQSQQFPGEDFEKLEGKSKVLVLYMKFHREPLVSYHLQLKLMEAFVPDMLAVIDESAEKLLCGRWVRLAAKSDVPPSADYLYTVQAVNDEGKVWMHTHGLCRAGFSELEIIGIDTDSVNAQYHLLNTTAKRMLYENKDFGDCIFLGEFMDGEPIVVTKLMWNEGIAKYPAKTPGGPDDRTDSHNTNSSILFLYLSEEDANNNKYTRTSKLSDKLADNPLYYFTNAETAQMQQLARERFEFVREAVARTDNEYRAMIKIGLPTDAEDGGIDCENLEHIWFELISFNGDRFRARLMQEPYRVSRMKEGDEAEFGVDDVTDWMLGNGELDIVPNTVYLLS